MSTASNKDERRKYSAIFKFLMEGRKSIVTKQRSYSKDNVDFTHNLSNGNDVTGEALIKKEVRQGCGLSPDLLNIYSEIILHGINDFKEIR